MINPSESGVGPVTIKDLAQPIFKQCGNGEPGERPKDKPDGGQIRVEGEPILPPAGVPEGSLGATRKETAASTPGVLGSPPILLSLPGFV